ncbi:MAG: aldo/keto reductase [Caldilineaceae bacterium SB0675_bin_29]|uniref:Aldo/keto reductase n=1 Tax=Caldilineaceae bacterium SB0675_bin_29 TaxID=2605266 RepID=A0A6B1G0X1_9CHLR|nr:aldo/keto reductase [Caldilineaceae bacterium SB0675_bin_29]
MIQQRPFGRTGHNSTVTLFGAAAIGRVTQADADRTMELLLDYGVNHIDTAASYGDAELLLGPWLEKHRDRFFLATKTNEREYDTAKAQIQLSLERMRVDHIDLIQFHNLGHPDDWDTAMGENGALEAAKEARDQGLVKHIGVTGHGLKIAAFHNRSLQAFDFDSILLPWNIQMKQNPQYAADFDRVVGLARQRGIAVQTIKSLVRGPWATTPKTRSTWYQPLENQPDIDRAVHWILAQGDLFLNTAGDINLLPKVLDAASRFNGQGPSDEEMAAMVAEQSMTPLFA